MAVALQRELDAYNDAIGKYVAQARHYKAQANQHNDAVDTYKASFVTDGKGEIRVFSRDRGGYFVPGKNIRMPTSQADQYKHVSFGNNQYGFQYKDNPAPKPGEFTAEEPMSPGPAPSVTAAQMKRLNQPSLTDVERVSDGLISNAFKY